MSIADDVRTALEQFGQSQAKILESYGGNPPPEIADQLQKSQEKMTGEMGWVQTLSDQAEAAKAKLKSQLEMEAKGQVEDEEEDVDFEAYPWQFQSDHGLAPDEMNRLVRSLVQASDRSA